MGEWVKWILVGWMAIGPVAMVLIIGIDRKPVTPGAALTSMIISGLIICAIVRYWGACS